MQMAKVRGERNFMKILVCSLSSLKRGAVLDAVTRPGWRFATTDVQSRETSSGVPNHPESAPG